MPLDAAMPSPFPGMNPYLENPSLWAGVHHWLITEIARSLNPVLRPRYFVAVEERVYETSMTGTSAVGIPDDIIIQTGNIRSTPTTTAATIPLTQPISVRVPVVETEREGYLEVREVGTETVITVIEILSPKNKRSGVGRQQYEAKRQKILSSQTHLVEIDLLRQWQVMPLESPPVSCHYRVLVSRSDCRPLADLYAFNLPDPIPVFPLPLQSGDVEPCIDLQNLLHKIYDEAGYDLRLDYRQDPVPPLDEAATIWLNQWLTQFQ
jgi:hypothetical protein